MRAGEAAAAAGVTIKALRYYEDCGLLSPGRTANGYRDYTAEDVRLAEEIRSLGAFGLTPKETGPFLACLRAGHDTGDHCAESLAAYQRKIQAIDLLVARLTYSRDQLVRRRDAAARRGFPSATEPSKEPDDMLPKAAPLPTDLPAPVDDGGAAHLPGRTLPALSFTGTDGSDIRLEAVTEGRWVLFLYPLTGDPSADIPDGWNDIPGARGCSQEACGFRDNLDALRAEGVAGCSLCPPTEPTTNRRSWSACICPIRCSPTPGSRSRTSCGSPPSRPTARRSTGASRSCCAVPRSSTSSTPSSHRTPMPTRWCGGSATIVTRS
ncbi:MerR family transcriptional regulator [Streptomyces sp. NPDC059171]|uniref:MerR family transcriptional regulator n=1 Tax=Streptomyces sp. NPDC059171 TaxID=3346755 RepID=UPI0036AD47CD